MKFSRITTDVLVIGGGLAGLSAALEARESGRKVIIVAKSKVARSGNTLVARNNLAVLIDVNNDESLALHLADTLNGGAGLNDPKLVSILVKEAREGINWLRDLGVPFVEEGGQLVVSQSQGHSCPRTVKADGKGFSDRVPGLALILPLGRQLESRGVDILNDVLIYALIRQGDSIVGAFGLGRSSPHLYLFQAGAVILASGGAGRIYASSTNTSDITGDGYAMAARAGAKVIDMEFVQFNPVVTIDSPKLTMQASPFAVGAELKNRLGEVFMDNYSSAGHMATRDVMARAILAEINAGRGTLKGGVYMDFSKIPSAFLKKKWPDIHNFLQGRQQVEVAPAVHFIMGGIAIDEECRSTISGLYACGEVAGGVHGANRLPGNALTEAVVFGRRAGQRASAEAHSPICWGTAEVDQILYSERICLDQIEDGLPDQRSPEISAVKAQLRTVMGSCAGVLRSTQGLHNASKKVQELNEILEQYRCNSYWEWLDICQARLMIDTALMILNGALGRKENLGAHYVD